MFHPSRFTLSLGESDVRRERVCLKRMSSWLGWGPGSGRGVPFPS